MQPESSASKHHLTEVMAGVAGRDPWAMATFYELATKPVRSIVLGAFRSRNMWISADCVDDIVQDLILELVELAPSWSPDGGAAPWNWARNRLVALAFTRLGMFCDDLDQVREQPADTGAPQACNRAGADGWDTLVALADSHPHAALLTRSLLQGVTERDRRVWVDFVMEKSNGNRSPAVTVAQLHDINPVLVRKVVQRVKAKLLHLAVTDDAYVDLLSVAALAA